MVQGQASRRVGPPQPPLTSIQLRLSAVKPPVAEVDQPGRVIPLRDRDEEGLVPRPQCCRQSGRSSRGAPLSAFALTERPCVCRSAISWPQTCRYRMTCAAHRRRDKRRICCTRTPSCCSGSGGQRRKGSPKSLCPTSWARCGVLCGDVHVVSPPSTVRTPLQQGTLGFRSWISTRHSHPPCL